jgi:hypothetical protein
MRLGGAFLESWRHENLKNSEPVEYIGDSLVSTYGCPKQACGLLRARDVMPLLA